MIKNFWFVFHRFGIFIYFLNLGERTVGVLQHLILHLTKNFKYRSCLLTSNEQKISKIEKLMIKSFSSDFPDFRTDFSLSSQKNQVFYGVGLRKIAETIIACITCLLDKKKT